MEDMTAPAPTATLHRADGSPLRVLVVDDEQMLTDLLSMALRMEGWEVRSAGSGFDALAQAREFDPDAMVLDIMMPDLDGMSVLQRLRHAGEIAGVALDHRLVGVGHDDPGEARERGHRGGLPGGGLGVPEGLVVA